MEKKKTFTDEELEKIRAARAEYARKWRKKNPGKSREYLKRYWLKRLAKMAEEN